MGCIEKVWKIEKKNVFFIKSKRFIKKTYIGTLEEEKKYNEENALLLEEYGCLQGQSPEEKLKYILSHGGCTFEDFRDEVLEKIRRYYNQ